MSKLIGHLRGGLPVHKATARETAIIEGEYQRLAAPLPPYTPPDAEAIADGKAAEVARKKARAEWERAFRQRHPIEREETLAQKIAREAAEHAQQPATGVAEYLDVERLRKSASGRVQIAYVAYKKYPDISPVWQAVQAFAFQKLRRIESAYKMDTAEKSADDRATIVALKICNQLRNGEFDPQCKHLSASQCFLAFVRKAVFNETGGAERDILRKKKNSVPFAIETEDEDGNDEIIENLDALKYTVPPEPSHTESEDEREYQRYVSEQMIPAQIRGAEREFLLLLIQGLKPGAIAKRLGISPQAAYNRHGRLMDKLEKLRADTLKEMVTA